MTFSNPCAASTVQAGRRSLLRLIRCSLLLIGVAIGFVAPVAYGQDRITIAVQGETDPAYSRVIFDFPVEVPYRVNKNGALISIVFDAEFDPGFAPTVQAGLPYARNFSYEFRSGRTLVHMDASVSAFPQHFRRGANVILDIYPDVPNGARPRFSAGPVERIFTPNRRRAVVDDRPPVAQQPVSNQPPQDAAASSDNGRAAGDQAQGQQPAGGATAQQASDAGSASTQASAGSGAGNEGATTNGQQEPPDVNGTIDIGSSVSTDEPSGPPTQAGFESALQNAVPTQAPSAPAQENTEPPEPTEPTEPAERPTIRTQDEEAPQSADVSVSVTEKSRALDVSQANARSLTGNETIGVNVESLPDRNGVRMIFEMQERVPAAAFERSGFLWIIFDRSLGLDNSGLRAARQIVEGRISSISASTNRDALIIRMNIRANQNLVMEARGNNWVLSLKDTPTLPRFPLEPVRRNDRENGNHIFIEASELGTKLVIEDPVIGDEIIVLPMLGAGRGVPAIRNYTEASLLASAQGIAIEPQSDEVAVERFRNGVAIKSDLLSSGPVTSGISQRLVDFNNWRMGGVNEFRVNKARLLVRLSMVPAEEKNQIRWDLARFYLAHGRASDTLGILSIMLENEPEREKLGEFLAVRGIANFQVGRLEEATEDLMKPDLNSEQDVELWRSLLAEAKDDNQGALNFYRRGKDMMGNYAEVERARFQLAVIRAAIDEGEFDLAETELGLLNGLDLPENYFTESIYLKGKLALAQEKMDEALLVFDDLSGVSYRPISAQARYSRVMHSLAMNDMEPSDAIAQLERLRYTWRGGRFESRLIAELANLYLAESRYDEALTIMRQGISYFPREATRRGIQNTMRETFKDLFLDGQADDLPPISAIGLFFKFQELTPQGAEGNRLVRRLADRLVNVDLLDRAAELYEYQVTTRSEGTAKAVIAARLAKIHILNKAPEKAVEILRATRQQRLPGDVVEERRWVESRALIEQAKFEEAEVLLEDDDSRQADMLRADLYWGARDWDRLIETNERLLGNRWQTSTTVSDLDKLYLIRSCIALSFTQDKSGLGQIRQRYGSKMRSGDFSNAFELLTSQEDLSGGELGQIASQIASVEKLRSFMRDYRSDFNGGS